jgi:SAM-dependent methyltransferase
MRTDWYKTFFRGLALDLWRNAVTPEQTTAEVDFLVEELDPPAGGRILDVPCGNGRHALRLARRGYRLTGVDLSDEFLAEARSSAERDSLEIEWRLADMRQLPGQPVFDGAYCMGNCFGYLEYAGMREFVAALAAALKPGARFVVETGMTAESALPGLAENEWMRLGEILMLVQNEYCAEESRLDTEYTFLRDGRAESGVSSHYVYTLAELGRMLEGCGLVPRARYGSTGRKPFELGDERLLLVAERV